MEPMNYRKESRIKKVFRIMLKDDESLYPALITSISKNGMSVKTPHVLPTYKAIDVVVKIGRRVVPIRGSVRWVHESILEKGASENEIGILLKNPPAEYTDYFNFIIDKGGVLSEDEIHETR